MGLIWGININDSPSFKAPIFYWFLQLLINIYNKLINNKCDIRLAFLCSSADWQLLLLWRVTGSVCVCVEGGKYHKNQYPVNVLFIHALSHTLLLLSLMHLSIYYCVKMFGWGTVWAFLQYTKTHADVTDFFPVFVVVHFLLVSDAQLIHFYKEEDDSRNSHWFNRQAKTQVLLQGTITNTSPAGDQQHGGSDLWYADMITVTQSRWVAMNIQQNCTSCK